jgi:hypothetical protein
VNPVIAEANKLLDLRKREEAVELLVKSNIIDSGSNDDILARMMYRLSRALGGTGKQETSAAQCRNILRDNPDVTTAQLMKLVGCNRDTAARAYTQVIEERGRQKKCRN